MTSGMLKRYTESCGKNVRSSSREGASSARVPERNLHDRHVAKAIILYQGCDKRSCHDNLNTTTVTHLMKARKVAWIEC